VGWWLQRPPLAGVVLALLVLAGLVVSPFDLAPRWLPTDPVAVDALPDVGDNQQIVYTPWPGRSPTDIEDQVTYPLTTALLGLPGVRTVRSSSALGFSTIYVIFDDDVEVYWSRSRVLEKLASLPAGTLPDGVEPTLGPDASALGQVFWYTLQGLDADGEVVGGFDPDELRTLQDTTVRYALQSVPGVSEVASVGGFVRELQVDVDPDALSAHGVSLGQVADAVRRANLDVGARTLEINAVEYVVRGLGFVQSLEDVEAAVVVARQGTPLRVGDVARVGWGPALRRGALDDAGAPAVGGVVVARYGANPRQVVEGVKERLASLAPSLPVRTLDDGTRSQVAVVPFYDRGELVDETLATLSTALYQQVLITALVVVVLLGRLRASLLVASVLPLGVAGTFVGMRLLGVDANLMALGGIAIAIGTMVDISIVFVENIEQHLATGEGDARAAVRAGAAEVAPAVVISVLTTMVSFLPVFGLTSRELGLFGPLAVTKTLAMGVALVLCLVLLPVGAWALLGRRRTRGVGEGSTARRGLLVAVGVVLVGLLAVDWAPLGGGAPAWAQLLAVAAVLGGVLGGLVLFERSYERLLRWVLDHKLAFATAPLAIVLCGALAAGTLSRGYMPPFDEGSFLYMPSTMPHASLGESMRMLRTIDAAIAELPEVDRVVGKIGRVESALDPAPVSMVETVITYLPEYGYDADGNWVRHWRDHIRSPADLWDEIAAAAEHPGLTAAPLLQPIEARRVMLQSGMRAPMGVKVQGPSLQAIEAFALDLEDVLRQVDGVADATVFAERVVGKPYLEIELDRVALARHGLGITDVQDVLEIGLGGRPLTRTVQGRERYGVRVRFQREERDSVEALQRLAIPTPDGSTVPLQQLADIAYVRGPQMIKSEDTFLTSYVLFDRDRGTDRSELAVVRSAEERIAAALDAGDLVLPEGVTYGFAGTFQQQLVSEARLRVLVPVAASLVFALLYLLFRRARTTLIIGSGVVVASGGAFVLLWAASVQLTVAVWVGLIALLGIATDDGVVMATYLRQRFASEPPSTVAQVRERTVEAGMRRVRPCLMTTATTVLALLPVVTSSGRGADVMVPLALPLLGGMGVELITLFVVPVLWSVAEERTVSGAPPPTR
jgi:Cu(I)/Ag(I) efflux system membrane protein CusA/SilA